MGEKNRLTITCDDDLEQRVRDIKDAEGHEYVADAGRELLDRGIEDWERDRDDILHYPGRSLLMNAIEISAALVLVVGPLSIALGDGLALHAAAIPAATMFCFFIMHYSILLMDDLGEI